MNEMDVLVSATRETFRIQMIIFLYGQNSYNLIQYVNQLIDRYQKKYPDSFNMHKFDLETDNQDEIRNAIKENSFFKQVKFVVVKNPFAKSDFLEKILKENDLEKQKDLVLLLYQTGEQEKFKTLKLFALLTKTAQIKEFKAPTIQAMNKFASSYIIDKKCQYAQILKKTKMHPFFFKKNYEAVQKYTLNDLKNIFQKVVDFEIGLKTGQVESENIFFKIFI